MGRGGWHIYKHFEALDEGKRQRIINAALREFGLHGYKKTPMEQVAKSAGIAKGMVFHYFGSKLGLYEYLFDFCVDFIERYFADISERVSELDFLEQYRYLTRIKLEAYTENPYVFEFYTMVFMAPENLQYSARAERKYMRTIKLREDAFASIIQSKSSRYFRKDVDIAKAKKYILWVIDGFTQQEIAKLTNKPLADMDLQPDWDEMNEILDDLKTVFYQQPDAQ